MSDPLIQSRLEKLAAWRARGVDPYPARVPPIAQIREVRERFAELDPQAQSGASVTIAGRVTAFRRMGKASFLDLRDGSGRFQVHATMDRLGENGYAGICDLDIGDHLAVSGEVFRTKLGELTVATAEWTLLSKAIRSLPEKWHGLKDVELRHRHRSLDLIANDEVRQRFVGRPRMIAAFRRELDERGYLEVETPTMQPIPGGAAARPFITHHNALDVDLYLRIAPELYLKRLVVGGFDRVYELGKCYRNEGVSTEHNPEFTMLELYQAYADYEEMMRLAETLIGAGLAATAGSMTVVFGGNEIHFTPPFRRVSMLEAIEAHSGIALSAFCAEDVLRQASARGIGLPNAPFGKLVEELFERFVEPTLIQPTFVCDYPVDVSPLAKRTAGDERLVERFELFAGGLEIANAFTELNDPLDQRRRFEEQDARRRAGDEEAQWIDEDFLFALEHGLPPTGGMGMGVDRLAMLFTGAESIRDVILFPAMRPREDAS